MHPLNAVLLGKTSRYCRGSSERGGAKHDVIMVPVTRFRRKKGYKSWHKFRDPEPQDMSVSIKSNTRLIWNFWESHVFIWLYMYIDINISVWYVIIVLYIFLYNSLVMTYSFACVVLLYIDLQGIWMGRVFYVHAFLWRINMYLFTW